MSCTYTRDTCTRIAFDDPERFRVAIRMRHGWCMMVDTAWTIDGELPIEVVLYSCTRTRRTPRHAPRGTGGTRLLRALFRGTPDARTFADDARPSIPASRRDDSASTVVLGLSRVAPELSHLSSKVATQSSTTRAARRRSRDAPCLASAGAQAMFGVIKNGRW